MNEVVPIASTLGEATACIVAVSGLLGSIAAVIAAKYGYANKQRAEDVKQKVENGGSQ